MMAPSHLIHHAARYLCIALVYLHIIFANECGHDRTVFSHLSSKAPYRHVQLDTALPYAAPQGCEPRQIWMLIRHGTRHPKKNIIVLIRDRLPILRNEILQNHLFSSGTLCESELRSLREWVPVPVDPSQEKFLVQEGERELNELAKRLGLRLPALLDASYSNLTYKFRFTKTQRTELSAKSFADGLFGSPHSRDVWYPAALKSDPILRFYKECTRWELEVEDNPETGLRERIAFTSGEHFTAMRRDVARRLGLHNVSIDDVDLMYNACAFETAMQPPKTSPWCAAFSDADLQVLDYAEDLDYYWNDGYGHEINYQQACPAVQDMLNYLQKASTEEESPRGVFHFSHSGAILKVLAYLGLYRDAEPLLHTNFEQNRVSRKWRTSFIDSFAANLGAVLYLCPEARVLLLHQERPVTLPGCPDSTPLCPLDVLLARFSDCRFHETCSLTNRSEL